MQATVLIVDDEKHTREGLRLSLEESFDVYVAADQEEAMEVLRNDVVDVMVTDLRLGSESGMDVVEGALAMARPPVCIIMTAYGSVDTAVEAMKRGAYDFVTKPLHIDALEILIKRALRSRAVEAENKVLRRQVGSRDSLEKMVGKSEVMQAVFDRIEQVAPTRATVLIDGESGTGKELAAHALHQLSGRPKDKLTIVHCAALSPQLLESELFGHEKGAFTGAMERRIGRFEQADGGTLFLDEIGEIEQGTQVKLLRALGEKTIERVGGNVSVKVDVRVIAATNRDLEKMVAEGNFREDLFYRLNVVKLTMPPLRERKEDLLLLIDYFLKMISEENGKPVRALSKEALQSLLQHSWTGNIRELRTAIEHGVVMSNGEKITLRHLPESLSKKSVGEGEGGFSDNFNLEEMERKFIAKALEKTKNNRTEAAVLLGISRRTLQRKLKEYKSEQADKKT